MNARRGSNPLPDWFELHLSGWICNHPDHGPDDVVEELGHSPNLAPGYALEHLDEHHRGWRIRCVRCGRPQWNLVESTRCFDCRD